MPQLGQLERDDKDVAPAKSPVDPQNCHRQWSLCPPTLPPPAMAALVPAAPPASQDTWAQGTRRLTRLMAPTGTCLWGCLDTGQQLRPHHIPAGGKVL